MTLETLLAAITAAGWYTRLVEVNSTRLADDPPSTWKDFTFRLEDGTITPRTWMADLHHNSGVKKHGFGPTALCALARAWENEEIERESHYLSHPQADRPAVDLSSLGLTAAPRPILRRI